MIGQAGEDVFKDTDPIQHLDPQLNGIAAALGGAELGIPLHRQAALGRHRTEVGAVLPVNRDAVVAEGNRADNRFAGQGTATSTQPVFQALQAQDRAGIAVAREWSRRP